MTETELNIQWKGTDACLDFYCQCGEYSHFDGYFAMALKCWNCEKVFELQTKIVAKELKEGDLFYDCYQQLEKDEELS